MSEPRINQLPSGLIDELFVEQCGIELRRTGDARYSIGLFFSDQGRIEVELWTSRTGRIETVLENAEEWIGASFGPGGQLQSLDAKDCTFHLEQLDRGHYWIGLTCEDGQTVDVRFSTNGYLKTRLVSNHK